MDYYKFSFTIDNEPIVCDLLTYELGEAGFESFDEEPGKFNAYISSDNFDEQKFSEALGVVTQSHPLSFTKELIKTINWNEAWESNYQPIEIDKKLRIIAPFHEKNNEFEQEIVILPKMSFGTGHHETTRMMATKIHELDLKSAKVLDMGSGTGVLAIYAERLGAGEVVAIDIEDFAYENAVENCQLNKCTKIRVEKGSVNKIPETLFNCILANINKNILTDQIPVYSKHLAKGGILLLSGFFESDANELIELCNKYGMKFDSKLLLNNWACVELHKAD